ncbi:hypothetical protein D3C72_2063510 [compost metagenome]
MLSTGMPQACASSTTRPIRRRLWEAVAAEKLVCNETASAPRRTAASTLVTSCFRSGCSSMLTEPLSWIVKPQPSPPASRSAKPLCSTTPVTASALSQRNMSSGRLIPAMGPRVRP